MTLLPRPLEEVLVIERLKLYFMRALFRVIVAAKWRGKVAGPVSARDVRIPVAGGDIGARIYAPAGSGGTLPVVLFFHGGGWIGGDVQTHDPLCRDLCVRSRHLVVSVDYRLAPEHPFPCAPQDCWAAVEWLRAHGASFGADLQRVLVCGDSAGGNLAAVTAIQARERCPGLIKGQILIYPVTDHYRAETASALEFANDRTLNRKTLTWLWDLYLRGSSLASANPVEHDLATPLRIKNLRDLPPALVLLAELDPLRDEGKAYALRLQDHGVKVQHTLYPGVPHGFVGVDGPTKGHQAAVSEIAAWLSATCA
jgi:acetyl esterase